MVKIIFILSIFSFLRSQASLQEPCVDEKCGRYHITQTELFKGNFVCFWNTNNGKTFPVADSKCAILECSDDEIAPDQRKCMCELCKRRLRYVYFCDEPGVLTSIGENECDTKVCAGIECNRLNHFNFFSQGSNGTAKYREAFCMAHTQELFEDLKLEMLPGREVDDD